MYKTLLRQIQKTCVRDEFSTQFLKFSLLSSRVRFVIPMAVREFLFTFLLHYDAIQFEI